MRLRSSVVALFSLVALAAGSASAASPRDAVRAWRTAHEKAILSDFTTFLAIPDVASFR